VGVSPTYIASIYTEHAGGDDQIIRDPVLWGNVPVEVSGGIGDRGGVAADVTPGVWMGICGTVLVDGVAGSVGDE
jgi:NAD(P)H-dependent flavin oxidoreductase YrpB (nitropropane dioxygenase family)